jgi:hypothetical protein
VNDDWRGAWLNTDRAKRLIDKVAVHKDAQYRATVETFRRWLEATEMAMEDEDVPAVVREAVLNRLVYATPSGAEAHERMEAREAEIIRLSRHQSPLVVKMPPTSRGL